MTVAEASKGPKNKRHARFGGLANLHRMHTAAEILSKSTHFTIEECQALIHIHDKIEEAGGPLDRIRMGEILHVMLSITDPVMLDLVFRAFDKDFDGEVSSVEWVESLSIILRGTTDELSNWCYRLYDINSDGGIDRDELAQCLKGCIFPHYGVESDELEDCERHIVEIAMKKMDIDKDGQITGDDFQQAVKRDPLLLVCIGPCLPPSANCAGLLSLITEKFRNFTGPMGRTISKKKGKPEAKSSMLLSSRSFASGHGSPLHISLSSLISRSRHL